MENRMDLRGLPQRGEWTVLYRTEAVSSSHQYREVINMREGIHPKYFQAKVTCNCGNTFTTGSTKPEIHVEICSQCHSFYTGQQKAAQVRGRIDKFNRKYGLGQN